MKFCRFCFSTAGTAGPATFCHWCFGSPEDEPPPRRLDPSLRNLMRRLKGVVILPQPGRVLKQILPQLKNVQPIENPIPTRTRRKKV